MSKELEPRIEIETDVEPDTMSYSSYDDYGADSDVSDDEQPVNETQQKEGPPLTSTLHEAVWAGRDASVAKQIASGTDVNTPIQHGRTPLHLAVRAGDLEMIRTLLRSGARVNEVDADGWTPLHFAASQNRLRVAEVLLDAQAKSYLRDYTGATACDVARACGHDEMVRLLS